MLCDETTFLLEQGFERDEEQTRDYLLGLARRTELWRQGYWARLVQVGGHFEVWRKFKTMGESGNDLCLI